MHSPPRSASASSTSSPPTSRHGPSPLRETSSPTSVRFSSLPSSQPSQASFQAALFQTSAFSPATASQAPVGATPVAAAVLSGVPGVGVDPTTAGYHPFRRPRRSSTVPLPDTAPLPSGFWQQYQPQPPPHSPHLAPAGMVNPNPFAKPPPQQRRPSVPVGEHVDPKDPSALVAPRPRPKSFFTKLLRHGTLSDVAGTESDASRERDANGDVHRDNMDGGMTNGGGGGGGGVGAKRKSAGKWDKRASRNPPPPPLRLWHEGEEGGGGGMESSRQINKERKSGDSLRSRASKSSEDSWDRSKSAPPTVFLIPPEEGESCLLGSAIQVEPNTDAW